MSINSRVKHLETKLQAREPMRILSKEETEAALRKITPEDLAAIPDDAVIGSLTGKHYKAIVDATIDFIGWRDRHHEQSPA